MLINLKSNQHRLELPQYKSIDLDTRSRIRNLIFRGIGEEPNEENNGCIKIDWDLSCVG